MNCPKCEAAMEQVSVADYTIDRCTGCGGLWFDLREHEHIATESKADVARVDIGDPARGRQNDERRDVSCPACHVKMLKMSVHGQPHIHYESCPVCHGAYFDAGEFADYAKLTLVEQARGFFRGFRRRSAKE